MACLTVVTIRSSTRRCLVPPQRQYRWLSSSSTTAAATTTIIEAPTQRQLHIVALRSAIPMVGFGFMDNLVMIQAGEAIDMSIGVTFGLSTLTAAGFGQCVSDVAGFTCGGIVDAGVARMQLPTHGLTPAQLDLKVTRTWHTLGGSVGVVTGCLLGMSCLLFMDTDRADRAKKARELQSIFETVLDQGHSLVRAGEWYCTSIEHMLWTVRYSYSCCCSHTRFLPCHGLLLDYPICTTYTMSVLVYLSRASHVMDAGRR